MSGLGVVIVCALLTGDVLTFRSEARVAADIVRLSDVANLSALPPALRERAASTPVARLDGFGRTLSSRRIAERARAAVPALAAWLPDGADQAIPVERLGSVSDAPATAMTAASPPSPDVRTGDRLRLRVRVGDVLIEREVEALQAARAGHRVFVRTAEGRVLTAPVELDR